MAPRGRRRTTPTLVTLETYGRSNEGRDLWLVTVTDSATGAHDTKPAHWVDASIHAVELTATVAATYLIHRLVTGTPTTTRRSCGPCARERSTSCPGSIPTAPSGCWPTVPGSDVRALGHGRGATPIAGPACTSRTSTVTAGSCRCALLDPNGAWMPHPDDARLLVPVPPTGRARRRRAYRLLDEGSIADYDGFTIPKPRAAEGLDLNRNFPAGWDTRRPGAGDHPLCEPEIDALVRAVVARPNVCGYNAFHTSGGVLLRPSSTRPDSSPPADRHLGVEPARRGRHRADGLPGALGLGPTSRGTTATR